MSEQLLDIDRQLGHGCFGLADSLRQDAEQVVETLAKLVGDYCSEPVVPLPRASVAGIARQFLLESAFVHVQNGTMQEAKRQMLEANKFAYLTPVDDPSATVGKLAPIKSYDGEPEALVVNSLFHAMRSGGYDGRMEFVTPTTHVLRMTDLAQEVLAELVPSVWANTRGSVYTFLVIAGEVDSAYNSEAPRAFIANEKMFCDPLTAADTILHETLHQKIADIRCTHLFFAVPFNDIESTKRGDVMVPWGYGAPRPFSLARALAAHHVYVHSSLLHAQALASSRKTKLLSSFGLEQKEIERRLRQALDRASFFASDLKSPIAEATFGKDAKRLLEWLNTALTSIASEVGISLKTYNADQVQFA